MLPPSQTPLSCSCQPSDYSKGTINLFSEAIRREEWIATGVTLAGLVVLFVTNDALSTSDTYLDLNQQSGLSRMINGKLMAFIGSFSLAVYFIISRQMKVSTSPPFNGFNISLFGVVVFFFINIFFEGFMHGDEGDDLFNIFSPW